MNFNKVMIILVFTLFPVLIKAQSNEIKARIEFEEAETAFTNENYEESLTHLKVVKTLLNNWTPLVSFLEIQCLDKTIDYNTDWNDQLAKLKAEIQQYMSYSDTNLETVVIEKIKIVYDIEKKVNYAYDFHYVWGKMPEFENGQTAQINKDYEAAMEWYQKASEKQNPRGIHSVGVLYENGLGVDKDYNEAFNWTKKAADLGSYRAMLSLGRFYHSGDIISRDYEKAMMWYKKAADKNNVAAMANIGILYYNGLGVTKDSNEALKWFFKAFENKFENAIGYIGDVYLYTDLKDYEKALKWYKEAAKNGDGRAMTMVGVIYHNGSGVTKDYNEALKWYKEAAKNNSIVALDNIGLLYRAGGNGLIKNPNEALKWFKEAASKNYANSMYNIANMYISGDLGAKDYTEALNWFFKAYENSNNNNAVKSKTEKQIKLYENGDFGSKYKKLVKEWRDKQSAK